VANLLLCRAMARQGELAVRAAMGASRARLVSQLFIEALVITSLAALAGIGAASAGLRWFNSYIPAENLPFWIRFDVNVAASIFAVLTAFAAAVLAGIVPSVRATRAAVVDVLKDEQRTSSSVRFGAVSGALTVAEVAVAVACLAAAGLAGRTLLDAVGTRGHMPSDNVLVADVVLNEASTTRADGRIVVPVGAVPPERWPAMAAQLRTALAALPGVRSVALATDLPMRQHRPQQIEVDREGNIEPIAGVRILASEITPELFGVFNARLLAGRLLSPSDVKGSQPVAVVNRALARRIFGGGNPVGNRLRRSDPQRPQPWLTIVGVVGDLPMNPSANGDEPGYYTPFAQDTIDAFSIAVRVDGSPTAYASTVRSIVRGIDDRIEISELQSHTEMVGDMLVSYKMMSAIFIALGAAALFLAVAGLYAVMSFSVTQRTREIGIRLALGASAAQVTRVVLRRGMRQIAVGLGVGSACGWMLMRLLALNPIGTAPVGPSLLAAAAGLMAAAGVFACASPMLRILRTRPSDALRT
jgi:predicted permease